MAKEVEDHEIRTIQAYGKFLKLLQEKKYAEMARYALDIHNNLRYDGSYEYERQGFEMICKKMAEYDNSPEAGDIDFIEKKMAIQSFGREIKKLQVDAQLKIGPMVEQWKHKIKNGEVEVLQFKKDDEPFVSAAANDIVVYQSEPGADLNAAVQTTLTFQTIVLSDKKWRNEIENDKEFHSITEHTSESPFIHEYIKTKDMPYEEALKYVTKYETPSEKLRDSGYEVDGKHKLEENGIPAFSVVPEYVKLTKASTIEEVEQVRKPHLDKMNQANAYYENAMQIAELSRNAWEAIKGKVPNSLRTDKYTAFRTALKVAGTIGTKDFEIETLLNTIKTDAIFPHHTGPVVKALADVSREYLQELDEGLTDEDKNKPFMVPILKTLKDITKQSAQFSQEMDSLEKVLPVENVEKLSEKESKILSEIDKAIETKGISPYDQMKKRHADERALALAELNACLEEIAEADKNVYNGSQEYSEAWTALGNLSGQVDGFNKMIGTIIEDGDHKSFIRMKGNREAARKNITDYLDKKAKKKKLSTKTQKRVKAMEKALKALDVIEAAIDKSELDIDIKNMQKESITLHQNAKDETRSPEERMAIKAAADSIDKMTELICRDADLLNRQDKQEVRSTIAAITIMERKLYNKTGQLTEKQYKEQVNKLAEDPDFIKATEKLMSKNSIADFCNNTKNGALSVLNDFYEVKNAAYDTPKSAAAKAVEKAVKKAAKKNTENTEKNNSAKKEKTNSGPTNVVRK